jgi:hypothetical protein
MWVFEGPKHGTKRPAILLVFDDNNLEQRYNNTEIVVSHDILR